MLTQAEPVELASLRRRGRTRPLTRLPAAVARAHVQQAVDDGGAVAENLAVVEFRHGERLRVGRRRLGLGCPGLRSLRRRVVTVFPAKRPSEATRVGVGKLIAVSLLYLPQLCGTPRYPLRTQPLRGLLLGGVPRRRLGLVVGGRRGTRHV